MRILIADTGPVLYLHEAGLLWLLHALGVVLIPPFAEFELRTLIPNWSRIHPLWLEVEHLSAEGRELARDTYKATNLDMGESEALALAEQTHAHWFKTDDASARSQAQKSGFEVHGSMGLALVAAREGIITRQQAKLLIERLLGTTLWVRPHVVARIRADLDALA